MRKLMIGLCAALCGLAGTANATAYTESDLTSGDNTLTLTEDSTLTVGSDISIGKLTVEGSGYTLTLAGSAAVTASSLEIGVGATVQLASGTTLANGALQTSTVTGAGVIGYTGVAPDVLESWADEDNWTGTVWVQGLSQNAWNPTGLGNANSTLRLSGFTGYFAQAYITVPFAVELENSTYSSAMNVNNGFSYNPSGKAYFATPTLKGSGTYTANTDGGSLFIVTDDWSGFTGTFALSGKTVWLGYAAPGTSPGWAPGDADVAAGTVSGGIRIAAGKSVDWNAGWTLTKFLGEGTIKMALPSEATPAFAGYVSDSSLWKGTVELAAHEATGSTSIWPARMGNANSKVVLKGLTSNGGSHWFGDTTTINTTLDIEGEVTIDNGSGSAVYTIARLTGKRNLNFHANLSKAIYININAISNYTGSISAISGKDVVYVHAVELDAAPAVNDKLFGVTTTSGNRNVNFNKPFTYVNGELLTYSASLGEDGFYVTDVGRDVYWVGGASGNWHDNNNWELSDGTKTQPSTYNDDHVFITNAATIVLNDTNTKALCSHITIDADTTFIGGGNYAAYGLYFDQMDGTGAVTLSNVWVAIISSGTRYFTISNNLCLAEGSANYFNCGNMVCYLYGDLSGGGSLYNYMSYANAGVPSLQCGALRMYGTNSEFSGTFSMDTASNRSSTGFYGYGASSSGKASWSIQANNNTIQTESFIRDDGDYYFGALNGYLNVGDHAATLHIGGHASDSSVAISSRKDVRIVKTGDTTFEQHRGSTGNSPDNKIAYYDIYGGTVILNQILPTTAFKFLGDGGILMTPSYEVTVEEVASQYYPDPSALIKNSTAPIGFDTGAEDFTWATALAASNTGGLTKKGSGTLTLTAAPLCSGPLVVAEGKLVMPPSGANFRNLALGTGATLELDLSGVTADGVLFSAPAAAGTTITAENLVIKNASSDCSVVINSSGSSVAVVKGTGATYTWVGGAKKTVNDEEVDDPAWETAANWQVGGEAASVAPGGLDSVVFNTAEPGFTLATAVSVMDMTVNAQGFAFSADFALSVLGDMTISTPGALSISGTGSLDVNGVASGITSVAMTPTTATSTIIKAHPYYTERFTVGADLALTSLDGAGTISSDADQTVTIAENATSTFYGSFTGDMSLTKSGKGTLALQGPSDFTGDLFINEGTLALSAYDYTSYVKFDFDAMNTNNWTTTESDGRIYVTRLKTRTGGCSSGQLSYSYFQDISSGAAYPELVEDSDYFGGKPCVKVSDGVQMAYQDSKSVRARAYGWMFVYQKNDTPSANKNLLTGGNSSGNDYLTLRPSGSWYAHRYQSDISDYLYSDGENDATFTAGKKSVISIPYSVAENDNRYEILDGAFNGVVAQMIGFSPAPPLEVRAAIETYLMQKWGCDAAIDNQYLPKTAHVTMAAGATLDLGGMTQTVKSFAGAGTVQNGTLKTADNTVTVTGDLTIPVTDNTTYVIDNSMNEVRLSLAGTATGVTIEVSQANNPVKVVTPDMNIQDEVTINVPAKWANYKTYSEHGCTIGRLPFVIRIR